MDFLADMPYIILARGLRGGVLFYDPIEEQVYRRTAARGVNAIVAGEPVRRVKCVTVETLQSLGRAPHVPQQQQQQQQQQAGPCPGHPGIEAHCQHDKFREYDLKRLYLRHGLRLRVVLHRSKVPARDFYRELHTHYFPQEADHVGGAQALIRSMGYALKSAVEDGVLFSGGNSAEGEGPVSRDTHPELSRHFTTADRLLEVYAKCYEWTHWREIIIRFGILLRKYFSLF